MTLAGVSEQETRSSKKAEESKDKIGEKDNLEEAIKEPEVDDVHANRELGDRVHKLLEGQAVLHLLRSRIKLSKDLSEMVIIIGRW